MNDFASALRHHCARKGTIAQLCKATGINRQQFNKYLAGQILPGARTMRKICAYLGVTEEQLLSGKTLAEKQLSAPSEIDFDSPPATPPADPPHQVLRNGFYRAVFPVHRAPGVVACWLVHVTPGTGGGQFHTCRNHFEDASALGFAANHIRYRGPVRYAPDEAFLIGTALLAQPLHGIIRVDLRPAAGPDYLSAIVLTRRPDGPVALSGVMQFLGDGCTGRAALAGMGVMRLDDPAADPVVVRMMGAAAAAGPNWMSSFNERNLRAEPLSGGSDLPEALRVRRLSV
ncbi:hypothetical protein DK847_05005 [Aestuariivirga litoralis]|uniref:HTH cro/C1-type domain-containing protein n=1 Tax=Aestuariivirga litoralis TaxID=2650924 RepID=A0A2W2AQY3_9HYPH|nr:helix-turn-helix transcriptional regulator [Aestuariivirga litoralis]PZF77791.1 hypothetical protein DK847_05005 [Aestuariivirga litoralis]